MFRHICALIAALWLSFLLVSAAGAEVIILGDQTDANVVYELLTRPAKQSDATIPDTGGLSNPERIRLGLSTLWNKREKLRRLNDHLLMVDTTIRRAMLELQLHGMLDYSTIRALQVNRVWIRERIRLLNVPEVKPQYTAGCIQGLLCVSPLFFEAYERDYQEGRRMVAGHAVQMITDLDKLLGAKPRFRAARTDRPPWAV